MCLRPKRCHRLLCAFIGEVFTRTAFHQKAGMNEPPMAGLFMKPEEVAKGIVKALATGQARKHYSTVALLYFAVKRTLFGSMK